MFKPGNPIVIPPMVSVFNKMVGWVDESIAGLAPSSATLSDDRAFYFPIILPAPCVIRRLWWANGATVSGNVDCGVYYDDGDKPGAKVITAGSTAQSGTNRVQFVDVTDTALAAGLYWLALVLDNATGTVFRSLYSSGHAANATTAHTEDAAFTLPASATPVESADSRCPLFGFSTVASP